MAAVILEDERYEDNDDQQPEQEEAVVEEAQVEEAPSQEDDIPEKYRGKSAAELVRMHQEAEKAMGRQSSEVGELRKVVDSYIQTQLEKDAPKASSYEDDSDDVDFFVDPDKAVAKAIEKHPRILEATQVTQELRKTAALAKLREKHPDMNAILQNERFLEWKNGSQFRSKLFDQADKQYDYAAADELFTLWKERQSTVAQAAEAEKISRSQAAKAANTGNVRGNPDGNHRKIYRRADIIKLMQNDPDRYEAMQDEIMRAYAEKRVR